MSENSEKEHQFCIPVYWTMAGKVHVTAVSKEKALEKAKVNADKYYLGDCSGDYLEDSFEIGDSTLSHEEQLGQISLDY